MEPLFLTASTECSLIQLSTGASSQIQARVCGAAILIVRLLPPLVRHSFAVFGRALAFGGREAEEATATSSSSVCR